MADEKLHPHTIYLAIQQIPFGKVATYGQIAAIVGYPRNARQVGYVLKNLPVFSPESPKRTKFHHENVPWWRVVSSGGKIAVRENFFAREEQARRLTEEDVDVDDFTVKLGTFGWKTDGMEEDIMEQALENDQ